MKKFITFMFFLLVCQVLVFSGNDNKTSLKFDENFFTATKWTTPGLKGDIELIYDKKNKTMTWSMEGVPCNLKKVQFTGNSITGEFFMGDNAQSNNIEKMEIKLYEDDSYDYKYCLTSENYNFGNFYSYAYKEGDLIKFNDNDIYKINEKDYNINAIYKIMNKQYSVTNDSVKIRQYPSVKSSEIYIIESSGGFGEEEVTKTIKRLNKGMVVTVTGRTNVKQTINGVSDFWYQLEYKNIPYALNYELQTPDGKSISSLNCWVFGAFITPRYGK